MIHVDRGRVPKPRSLDTKRAEQARLDASEFFSRPPADRAQERHRFDSEVYDAEDIVEALSELFYRKCAFCETRIEASAPVDVEQLRPNFGAIALDGEFEPDHYYWLAYDWSNLYPICVDCARSKGHRFPVKGQRAPLGTEPARIDEEEVRLVIDPCRDDPEQELVFDEGVVSAESERGQVTIELLSLNRTGLIADRRRELSLLEGELDDLAMLLEAGVDSRKTKRSMEALREALDPSAEFAAMKRQFASKWTQRHKIQLDQIPGYAADAPGGVDQMARSVPKVSKAKASRAKASYAAFQQEQESYSVGKTRRKQPGFFLTSRLIERVEITNFRNIHHLEFSVPSGRGAWLMFLGENGTGKSSILQAVALTLVGRTYRSQLMRRVGLDPASMVRRGEEKASVRVFLNGLTEPVEMTFTDHSRGFTGRPQEPKALLLGYGATRLLPREARRQPAPDTPGFASVDNLFDPFIPLKDTERWLLRLQDDAFETIAGELRKLLPLDPTDRLERIPQKGRTPARIQTMAFGSPLSFRQLSDGYQSVLALVTDVMQVLLSPWLTRTGEKAQRITPDVVEGVVLIDELEAHLHPTWKMQIVKSLRDVFPLVQFLVTTHDPLCLRGLRDGEVMVMKRSATEGVYGVTDLPSIAGLRTDQILTSEHFGLSSTIDPEIEALFNEYYALKVKPSLSPDEQPRLQDLRRRLEDKQLMGHDQRERMMLEAIDSYLAQVRVATSPSQRKELKDRARQQVQEIYTTVAPTPSETP